MVIFHGDFDITRRSVSPHKLQIWAGNHCEPLLGRISLDPRKRSCCGNAPFSMSSILYWGNLIVENVNTMILKCQSAIFHVINSYQFYTEWVNEGFSLIPAPDWVDLRSSKPVQSWGGPNLHSPWQSPPRCYGSVKARKVRPSRAHSPGWGMASHNHMTNLRWSVQVSKQKNVKQRP